MMNFVPSPAQRNGTHQRYLPAALRIGLVALTLLPLAAVAGPNDPVTLRFKFKQGDANDYQFVTQLTFNVPGLNTPSGGKMPPGQPGSARPQPSGMNQQTNMIQHIKVVKVLPNGNADLEVTSTNLQGGGTPSKPMTMTYDPLGNLLAIKGEGVPAKGMDSSVFGALGNAGMASAQGTYLPTRAVKPGDTWTTTVKIPGYVSNGAATSKFIKMTTVGRFNTAHIQTTISLPIKNMLDASRNPTTDPNKAELTTTGMVKMVFENDFAVAEGKLIRSSGNGTVDVTMTSKAGQSPNGSAKNTPQKFALSVKLASTSNLMQK